MRFFCFQVESAGDRFFSWADSLSAPQRSPREGLARSLQIDFRETKDYLSMAANKTSKNLLILLVLGLLILLAFCKPSTLPRIKNTYQNPDSELIETLLTEQELSEISKEFAWYSILSKQKQNVLDPDTSTNYELSDRMYRGYFQNSDNSVTVWHTITKYVIPIDKNKLTLLELGGALDNGVTSTYIPNIVTSGIVTSKCVTLHQTREICEVDIKYNYVESNIYLSTVIDYEEEVLSNWLNAMVSATEPRIMLEDFGK